VEAVNAPEIAPTAVPLAHEPVATQIAPTTIAVSITTNATNTTMRRGEILLAMVMMIASWTVQALRNRGIRPFATFCR
jgi:hypothetical protein